MNARRITPCLDTKDGKVVKGVRFEGLSEMGDPVAMAVEYEGQGADEITLLDISASGEGRKTMLDLVARVSDAITVPLVVGGGISSVDDAIKVLDAGADRVSMNSAAVRRPALVGECALELGGEAVVVAIDAVASGKSWKVCVAGGREVVDLDAVEWARRAEGMGAGSILLTSKDADGVKEGYDIPLTAAVSGAVSIPVTASGGCGSMEHIYEVFAKTKARTALAASVFHYGDCTVAQAKEYLRERGIGI
ncbi:MAG: imidazole glycerol phosphate synthase subunit HisF [Thermoplasmatales archaeon]|nr:imidazole glycerol phosphate synthase subunit HisF [Thermoplasmatales archaeon]